MSDMEYNKGKLIPTGIDTEHFTGEDWDNMYDNGQVAIDGEVYSVEWDVCGGELPEVINIQENNDGSINFETYHYNGGGHWTEVVENYLNKNAN